MAHFERISQPKTLMTKMGHPQSCRRCGGFFILDCLFDFFDAAGKMWCTAFRCVQCGNIVDSLILKHQATEQLPNPKKQHHRRWAKLHPVAN